MTGRATLAAALLASGTTIAVQVGSKATRDALFLSNFPVTSLPTMVMISAILSMAVVLWATGRMTAKGPARTVPLVYGASAALLLTEWALMGRLPRLSAVLLYLHIGALGALLVSGFWSLVTESIDPRTAKRRIGWIGGAGTAGGLLGGVLAERVAAGGGLAVMFPVLIGLHAVAVMAIQALRPARRTAGPPAPRRERHSALDGLRLLTQTPYLRTLALLVLIASVSEGLLDYVFKGRAAAAMGSGPELLRLFAAFYTGVALLTFLVQTLLGRVAFQRLGLGGSVSTLPVSIAAGSVAALAVPGLGSAALARGAESVTYSSFYRMGHEILFSPLPREERRATKTILDVGVMRVGDIVGSGIIQSGLFLLPGQIFSALLALLLGLAAAGIAVARKLQTGYRLTLERALVAQGRQLPDTGPDPWQSAALETVAAFDVRQLSGLETLDLGASEPDSLVPPGDTIEDAELAAIAELRSGDASRILRVIQRGPPAPGLIPHLIPLLARDDVTGAAIRCLREIAPRITGQLLDALLDPDQEFTIRRRIPGILAHAPSQRAVDGLLLALADRRFEVRYRSGQALARLREAHPELSIAEATVYRALLAEVQVDRAIWDGQRLLDQLDDLEETGVLDRFLRDRAGRSLEHVFTMLTLVLPAEPLRIAFRGLFTDDQLLRGTALEYLEASLPEPVRVRLWPYLEAPRTAPRPARPREAIMAELLQSNESIVLNLEEIRKRLRD
ncbi:MAG: hypothetical protein AB7I33_09255 [Gemmatimonadales bacterium]